jgi:uncharacterized protein
MRQTKIIRDAVHGDIAFSREEMRLIDTAAVQRLRGIRQLGMANLVYPSAVHTRFEHALGTCFLAGKIADAVELSSGQRFTKDEHRLLRAAALLHDITHVPFGHTFEDERRLGERHDRDAKRLDAVFAQGIGDELDRQDLLDGVRRLLTKGAEKPGPPILYDIVAGTICADLLDYLRRDAFHCGLSHSYDDRVFSLFTRIGGRLVLDLQRNGLFRHDALSELVHLLRMRYVLTERVYYHHAKVSAGAMISKALEMALAAGIFAYEELYGLRDDAFLYLLRTRAAKHSPLAKLLDALERRSLYKPVYLLTLGDFETPIADDILKSFERRFHLNEDGARTAIESDLADFLGLPPGGVIVYCPSTGMALKEARVEVRIDDTTTGTLAALRHPEVEVLLEKHRRLWRMVVLVAPTTPKRMNSAALHCESLFSLPNMLPRQSRGQLSFAFRNNDQP